MREASPDLADPVSGGAASRATPSLRQPEFIALIGTLFATIAFSIDAMLPALPEIADELSPDRPQLAQLILTSFVFGMGVGTFIVGPLSDAFGRRRVIFGGVALYMIGAIWAWFATSLDAIVAARILAGIGVAGPRIVTLAIVRDLYSGRVMARIVSFGMMVFTIFPAFAPLIGAAIIAGFGWRAIFLSFLVFGTVSTAWLAIRQPETLLPAARRPLRWPTLRAGFAEALRHRQMQLSIVTQTLVFGVLFGTLSSIQQIFDLTYGAGAAFPVWFFFIAALAFPAAPTNGLLVTRFGMRPLIRRALVVVAVAAAIYAAIDAFNLMGDRAIYAFFALCVVVFGSAAFTIGNLNALALEPLGHIAGLASSLMGGLATVGGAIIGTIVGQLYDGTGVPLALCVVGLASCAALVMLKMPRQPV